MKKILQALDGVAERKVEGANDMKKFLSIVAKEPSKEPVKQTLSESVITSFDEDTIGGDANSFLIAADNINDLVMGNVDKIKINADERLLKDMMEKFNSFMTAYHAVGKEILQPDMFNDGMGESTVSEMDKSQTPPGRDGGSSGGKETYVKPVKADDVVKKGAKALDKAMKDAHKKDEGVHNGLAFKDYFALEEAKKTITKKEDPCWSGYHMVGTKNKGGKEVPNCVPGKKGS